MKWLTACLFAVLWILLIRQISVGVGRYPEGVDPVLDRAQLSAAAERDTFLARMKQAVRRYDYRTSQVEVYEKACRLVGLTIAYDSILCGELKSLDGQTASESNAGIRGAVALQQYDSMLSTLIATVEIPAWPLEGNYVSIEVNPYRILPRGGTFTDYHALWKSRYAPMNVSEKRGVLLARRVSMQRACVILLSMLFYKGAFYGGCGWDAITAIAVPSEQLVLPGDPVRASVLIASYDKFISLKEISVSRGTAIKDGGIYNWKDRARGCGRQTVHGILRPVINDTVRTCPWQFHYRVLPADDMQLQLDHAAVLYRGVANTVRIIPPAGYDPASLRLRIPGMDVVRKEDGSYAVTAAGSGLRQARALLTTNCNGAVDTLYARILAVRDLPVPDIDLHDAYTPDVLGTIAQLKLEESDYSGWTIAGYSCVLLPKDARDDQSVSLQGAGFASEEAIIQLLQEAHSGDRILIHSILLNGPYGKVISPHTYTIRVL